MNQFWGSKNIFHCFSWWRCVRIIVDVIILLPPLILFTSARIDAECLVQSSSGSQVSIALSIWCESLKETHTKWMPMRESVRSGLVRSADRVAGLCQQYCDLLRIAMHDVLKVWMSHIVTNIKTHKNCSWSKSRIIYIYILNYKMQVFNKYSIFVFSLNGT